MLIAWYTQHLILSFVNLEKKINERKEFCDAETLNQQKWKYEFYTILANVICFETKIRLLKEKILK